MCYGYSFIIKKWWMDKEFYDKLVNGPKTIREYLKKQLEEKSRYMGANTLDFGFPDGYMLDSEDMLKIIDDTIDAFLEGLEDACDIAFAEPSDEQDKLTNAYKLLKNIATVIGKKEFVDKE